MGDQRHDTSALGARGWHLFPTAIGECAIAWSEDAIVGVHLPEPSAEHTRARMRRQFPGVPQAEPPAWVRAICERTAAVLGGAKDDLLDVPLDMRGVPPFHQRVYEAARRIPPGRVTTYGEMARDLGEPRAARAVGQALGNNPFAPIVPCHRILAAHGGTGGFSASGGARTKMRMLEIEGALAPETLALFGAQQ